MATKKTTKKTIVKKKAAAKPKKKASKSTKSSKVATSKKTSRAKKATSTKKASPKKKKAAPKSSKSKKTTTKTKKTTKKKAAKQSAGKKKTDKKATENKNSKRSASTKAKASVKKQAQNSSTAESKTSKQKLVDRLEVEESTTYLSTPSEKMLKSFRAASKRAREQAAKAKVKRKGTFLAKAPRKGKKYEVDLRVHSPGTVGYFTSGGVNPGPALVRLAKIKGLDVIGLTDYYNASYIDAVREHAQESSLCVIPGIDVRCIIGECKEVFLTCLFPETYGSEELFRVLNDLKVPSEAYGNRDYCLDVPIGEVIEIVERHGGVLIPSRLDKTPYRQLAIPTLVEKFGIRAFDLVHPENQEFFEEQWPDGGFLFFTFSNATALAQIGNRSAAIKLPSPGFEGLKEVVQRRTE